MRLLRVAILIFMISVLLTAAVIGGYGRDRESIRWFPGSGIAAKVDSWGASPDRVRIQNIRTGAFAFATVWSDGSFIAPLPPGVYRVQLPNDGRTVTITVPSGQCLDVILDYRIPWVAVTVPG